MGKSIVLDSLEIREMTVGINNICIRSTIIALNLRYNGKIITFHID